MFVYIVYMKYVVCLHCVCEICCMFILVCENILPVYNFGQHGASIRDDRLPSNSIASSYLVMGIVNNTKEISAVVGGEDSQDPMIIGL